MPKQILIVEDHPDHRRILALKLRPLGHTIIEAATGEDGLEKALAELPDLIIMDLALPGVDGFETTIRLKQNPKTAAIPVIAYTVLGKSSKAKAKAAGMVEFTFKTDPPKEFLKLIKKYLGDDE